VDFVISWSFLMLMPKVMTGDAPDRRRRPRLRLAYPVRLRQPGEELRVETKTEDLSCEGFFCISEHVFAPHDTLECELVIRGDDPGPVVVEQNLVLRCRAEVVRVVPRGPSGTFGVACRFADYKIGRQSVDRDLTMEYSA
jgi:hypothetical protein